MKPMESSNLFRRTGNDETTPYKSGRYSFMEHYADKKRTRKNVDYFGPFLKECKGMKYIEYTFRIPEDLRQFHGNKKSKRFKVYENINRVKTDEYANELLKVVEAALEKGYNPFRMEKEFIVSQSDNLSPQKEWTINQALLYFLQKWQDRGLQESSMVKYNRVVNMFIQWLNERGLQNEPIENIKRKHVEQCLYDNKKTNKWSNRTFNNSLDFLNTVFLFLVKNEIAVTNPCVSIDSLQSASKKHKFYDEKTLAKVKEKMIA